MKLKPLKKGDGIALAAPAGPFGRRRFLRGISLLKKSGFRVSFRKDIFSRRGYLAGDDRRRASELAWTFADPRTKAILFARGGYGCQRLLPLLSIRPRPKAVVGSSDLTVLLNFLWKRFRLPTLYGPMVAPHLILQKNVSRLARVLTERDGIKRQGLTARRILRRGTAEGRLVGGCLSLVVSTLGTPWKIETQGTILFLEDTHEEPYQVDRMLTQLEQAGKLKNVRGIVLGTFRQGKVLFPPAIEKVFREKLKSFRGPVLWGLRFGHCPDPLILPLGGRGRIEGRRLVIREGIFTTSQ